MQKCIRLARMLICMRRFPEPKTLYEAVEAKLKTDQQKAVRLALERKYDVAIEPSSVSRWASGGGFSYDNVLMLLDFAGWLNEEAVEEALLREDRARAQAAAVDAAGLVEKEERAPNRKRRAKGA